MKKNLISFLSLAFVSTSLWSISPEGIMEPVILVSNSGVKKCTLRIKSNRPGGYGRKAQYNDYVGDFNDTFEFELDSKISRPVVQTSSRFKLLINKTKAQLTRYVHTKEVSKITLYEEDLKAMFHARLEKTPNISYYYHASREHSGVNREEMYAISASCK